MLLLRISEEVILLSLGCSKELARRFFLINAISLKLL
jgi:hypothetical protein